MKWRGKSLTLDVVTSSGAGGTKRLLDAPRYDPRWQIRYEYAEPVALAARTTLRLRGLHDNSANNPNNPDPSQLAVSGAGAGNEAMFVAIEVLVPVAKGEPKQADAR